MHLSQQDKEMIEDDVHPVLKKEEDGSIHVKEDLETEED